MDRIKLLRLAFALAAALLLLPFLAWAQDSAKDEEIEKASLPSVNGIDIEIFGNPDPLNCFFTSTILITVSDFDIGTGSLTDPITLGFTSSGGDSESLSLAQFGGSTNPIWRGTIPVAASNQSGVNTMDGTIDCTQTDILTFTYDDSQNGGASGINEFLTIGATPVTLMSFTVE